jgi:hypothetical protein
VLDRLKFEGAMQGNCIKTAVDYSLYRLTMSRGQRRMLRTNGALTRR